MHIRDGLVDPKHYATMGEAIWLYLYLHKACASKTGIIRHYQHQDAADALGVGLRTVNRHLQRLKAGGYVTITRHRDYLTVTITRYTWQEGRQNARSDMPEMAHHGTRDMPETALQEVPHDVSRSATSDTASIFTPSFNEVNDTTADAVDAVASTSAADAQPSDVAQHEPTKTRSQPANALPPRSLRRTHVTAPPAPPDVSADAARVAEVWMFVNRQPPAKAHPATIAEYQRQSAAMLARGYDADDLIGCLRYLASMVAKQGRQWRIREQMLCDRIGQWLDLPGKPSTWTPPAAYQPHSHRDPPDPGASSAPVVPWREFVVCKCGKSEGRKHAATCTLGGAVTPTWYVPPESAEADGGVP